jgi:hypothetical protein
MEPLPQPPIQIPQGRRLTRIFKCNQSKQFQAGDRIEIEIPPCKHSYLTKDCRVHFDMDLTYTENTDWSTLANFLLNSTTKTGAAAATTDYQPLSNFFEVPIYTSAGTLVNVTPEVTSGIENILKKPTPFLDSNGPYGLFGKAEVYDYLGNTLLEDINAHDLIASIQCDFDGFDPQLNRMRPIITDVNENFTMTSSRSNSVNLFDQDGRQSELSKRMFAAPSVGSRITLAAGGLAVNGVIAGNPITVPTARFSIKLLNFLGDQSNKFAPLHNGYRIVLYVNDPTIPIKFNMASGISNNYTNNISLRSAATVKDASGTTTSTTYSNYSVFTFTPKITKFVVSNFYLKCDLLEVTPELDSQVDKTLHTRMYHRHVVSKEIPETPIPVQRKSMRSISVLYRPRQSSSETFNSNGFRMKTYVETASLLYNGAKVKEFTTPEEFLTAMPSSFSDMISISDFTTDVIGDTTGTAGLQYLWIDRPTRITLAAAITNANSLAFAIFKPSEAGQAAEYNNYPDGKFIIYWDLALLGYDTKNLTGVDTSKNYLTYKVSRSQSYPYTLYTDAVCEYDAFIHVDPGKTTSVSC